MDNKTDEPLNEASSARNLALLVDDYIMAPDEPEDIQLRRHRWNVYFSLTRPSMENRGGDINELRSQLESELGITAEMERYGDNLRAAHVAKRRVIEENRRLYNNISYRVNDWYQDHPNFTAQFGTAAGATLALGLAYNFFSPPAIDFSSSTPVDPIPLKQAGDYVLNESLLVNPSYSASRKLNFLSKDMKMIKDPLTGFSSFQLQGELEARETFHSLYRLKQRLADSTETTALRERERLLGITLTIGEYLGTGAVALANAYGQYNYPGDTAYEKIARGAIRAGTVGVTAASLNFYHALNQLIIGNTVDQETALLQSNEEKAVRLVQEDMLKLDALSSSFPFWKTPEFLKDKANVIQVDNLKEITWNAAGEAANVEAYNQAFWKLRYFGDTPSSQTVKAATLLTLTKPDKITLKTTDDYGKYPLMSTYARLISQQTNPSTVIDEWSSFVYKDSSFFQNKMAQFFPTEASFERWLVTIKPYFNLEPSLEVAMSIADLTHKELSQALRHVIASHPQAKELVGKHHYVYGV